MRVFADMTDIVLDIPNAYQTLGKFVERGVEARFVSPRLALEIPSRYNDLLAGYLNFINSLCIDTGAASVTLVRVTVEPLKNLRIEPRMLKPVWIMECFVLIHDYELYC